MNSLGARVAVGVLGLAQACAQEPRRPPKAPSADLSKPALLIPSDVDLVLRLDIRSFRDAEGASAPQVLTKLWREFLLEASESPGQDGWISRAVQASDAAWVGCRLGRAGCTDFVVVLRGQFSPQNEHEWMGADTRAKDLGAGWVSYERTHAARTDVARAYFRAPELAVLISPAEVDSAERSVELAADNTHLLPTDTGLVSAKARSAALAESMRLRSPKAADWLRQSEQVEIRIDREAQGSTLTFAVTFADAERARLAAEALRVLVASLARVDARLTSEQLRVEQLAAEVVLRVHLRESRVRGPVTGSEPPNP